MSGDVEILHASAAAFRGRAVLIRGRSGAGKSGLLLDLMACGAALVADDRVCVARRRGRALAWAPPTILGRIEARGVGILRAEPAPPTPLAFVVDLDTPMTERLPSRRCDIAGCSLPLIAAATNPYACSAILQALKGGMEDLR